MKIKTTRIQNKIIKAFLASGVLAVIILFAGFIVASLINMQNYKAFTDFIYKNMIWLFPLTLLIFIIIMCVFLYIFTRKGMKRLTEVTEKLEEITSGNLEVRLDTKGDDELQVLAETVNNMAARLDMLIKEERGWEKAKNDMISNISHDLRTPLTSVLGYLDIIENKRYEDEESLKNYSRVAGEKCRELKILIDELFEYSKLNSTGIKLDLQSLDLKEMLEQVLVGFMPELTEANMEYRLHCKERKIMAEVDPVLFVRVLNNLISNAIKYGHKGKHLDIELFSAGGEVVIKVINYDSFIKGEDLANIFERFYRVEKSRSRQSGGTGLGLAIVKSIVELHKGKIIAESDEDRTVFEIKLKNVI